MTFWPNYMGMLPFPLFIPLFIISVTLAQLHGNVAFSFVYTIVYYAHFLTPECQIGINLG